MSASDYDPADERASKRKDEGPSMFDVKPVPQLVFSTIAAETCRSCCNVKAVVYLTAPDGAWRGDPFCRACGERIVNQLLTGAKEVWTLEEIA